MARTHVINNHVRLIFKDVNGDEFSFPIENIVKLKGENIIGPLKLTTEEAHSVDCILFPGTY